MSDDPRVQRARDVLKYRTFGDTEGVIRDLLAAYDELQAKVDGLTPTDPTLCSTCGCNEWEWVEGCQCPARSCGCWAVRQQEIRFSTSEWGREGAAGTREDLR